MATALMKISGDHKVNANRYQMAYQSHKCEYFRQQSYIFDPKLGVNAQALMEFLKTPQMRGVERELEEELRRQFALFMIQINSFDGHVDGDLLRFVRSVAFHGDGDQNCPIFREWKSENSTFTRLLWDESCRLQCPTVEAAHECAVLLGSLISKQGKCPSALLLKRAVLAAFPKKLELDCLVEFFQLILYSAVKHRDRAPAAAAAADRPSLRQAASQTDALDSQ